MTIRHPSNTVFELQTISHLREKHMKIALAFAARRTSLIAVRLSRGGGGGHSVGQLHSKQRSRHANHHISSASSDYIVVLLPSLNINYQSTQDPSLSLNCPPRPPPIQLKIAYSIYKGQFSD